MSPLDHAACARFEVAADGAVFACDVNLGFPTDQPEWATFFKEHGWRTVDYSDMGQLTKMLKAHGPAASFLPAANYYYLKDDPFYSGFASALAMKTGGATVDSVLIVPKASPAHSIADLKGKRLGCINLYCTTSYFAPAILLSEHNVRLEGFFSEVRLVGAWQRQIDALIAGEIDATMVEEGIWRDSPANHEATKAIGRVERLPGPVVVLAKTVDTAFASTLLPRLLAARTAKPHQPFAGYAPYCRDAVEDFFRRSARAFAAMPARS